jgi:DNA polymerase I-like protein with 3'-5' exonuclease and polymerase domains
MAKIVVGLDIETDDYLLKVAGYSWKYGRGFVLATALYFEAEDKLSVVAGIHNENCPWEEQSRRDANELIKNLLKNPDVSIVGANLQYDIGWLLYEYGMTTYDVKCSFIDVLQAEHILNENSMDSLDTLSWKYLKYGKKKERIEDWVHENVSSKGDFRQHLAIAPWELLDEYVSGDAKNPVKIWRKQLTLLKREDLCKRAKLEFDCILPSLAMTRIGIPIDTEQKAKNLEFLDWAIDKLHKDFMAQYNLPKFRVTAPRDIASFLDMRGIPYKCAITLKGYNGKVFADGDETDRAYSKAKQLVSSFRLKKGKPVAYVSKEMAERTCELLKEEGYMFNCSPNIDKKYFESKREAYPEVALIADWKLATGIRSKILGTEYNRFITKNFKDEYCIRPQFKITDTLSFRYSSVMPNGQQIPSKGGFKLLVNGEEMEISFPAITRALFTRSKGCVFGKIDYGQIEYRLICNIACGESGAEVRRQYAENPHMDFHQYVVDLTGLSRKYAKNMSFGVSFGMGLPSMAETFGWTMEKAEEISEKYHEHMPFVAPTLALVGDVAKERGYIKTVYGSHARLLDKKKSYTMLNRYTQGSGAECLKLAIVNAYKEGLWEKLKVANTVHDELNMPYLEPTEEDMLNLYRMAELMRTSMPNLRVPLEAEIELGDNWANTKEIKDWVEIRETDKEAWEKTSPELKQAVSICEKLIKEGRVQSA